MREEPTPFGPSGRFVGQEHFPGYDGDDDVKISAAERSDLAQEKSNMEDAILDQIDNPYSESTEFVEDMRGVEEEDRKSMGWTTNFKSSTGGMYPNESEAEILDKAIKDSDRNELDELEFPSEKELKTRKGERKPNWVASSDGKHSAPGPKYGAQKPLTKKDPSIRKARENSPKN